MQQKYLTHIRLAFFLWDIDNIVQAKIRRHILQCLIRFSTVCLQDVLLKIVSEYDQEIPQSHAADKPVAPRGRAAQPSRDTRKTN